MSFPFLQTISAVKLLVAIKHRVNAFRAARWARKLERAAREAGS